MPFLARLLSDGFLAVVAWLSGFLGRRVAVGVTVGATFVAGTVALQGALYALWSGLNFAMPQFMSEVMSVVAAFIPSNFAACVAALSAGKLARWLWDMQREWVKTVAGAS